MREVNLPISIHDNLVQLAKKFGLKELILFGSRAKGTSWERSDIDLAAPFDDVRSFFEFEEALEEIPTLLSFDVIDLNSDLIDRNLLQEIRKDGVNLYEKV